jgi:hypothetical protein
MSETVTSRLALTGPTPSSAEPVDIADHLNANWAKIDEAIGAFPCTSGTRPGSPFDGMFIRETDTGLLYVRNGTGSLWLRVLTEDDSFVSSIDVDVQEFDASGTWTKPAGAVRVLVEGVAGGGEGGDAAAAASGANSKGSGGGGGEYRRVWFDASDLASTVTVTIGAGGTGGSGTGNSGGNTSFGTAGAHMICNGGSGGGQAASSTAAGFGILGGAGGTGGSGGRGFAGGPGGNGMGSATLGASGPGGNAGNGWGGGGTGRSSGSAGNALAGIAGSLYGGGGGGGLSTSTGGSAAGGAGAAGLLRVTTYIAL